MIKKISLLILCIFLSVSAFAGDYHQNGQSHRVTYMILDSNGKPVTGQTVRLALERSSDGYFLDFSNGSFLNTGWVSRFATMAYDVLGEHYYTVISVDNGGIISGDYVCIISNDNTTYSDHQAETVEFDSLAKLVKINR